MEQNSDIIEEYLSILRIIDIFLGIGRGLGGWDEKWNAYED